MREYKDRKGFDYLTAMYEHHGPYTGMAITHLLSIGFNEAKQITNKDLADMKVSLTKQEEENEKNGVISIMTPDFQVWLVETARDISLEVSEVRLIQWCIAYRIFDSKGIKKRK